MDVDRFLEKAEQALRRRAPDQAIALYRQALVGKPGHGPARAGLLAAYRRRAELKGGPSLLDRAAARSLAAAASGLRASKQFGAAAKSADAGLEKCPEDAALTALLAECLAQLGRKEEALAVWTARLEAEARDVAALKAAGLLCWELRRIEEATAHLERAHALDRHDPEVERLRKQLAAEGTLSASHYATATSSRELIKDRDSLRRAEAATRLQKTEAELDEQIAALAARHAAEPGQGEVRRNLVAALATAGRHDEACAVLDAAAAAAPHDTELAEAAAGQHLARLTAALAAARASGDEVRATALEAERRAAELADLERRVALRPGEAALRVRLGRALYRAGETDRAIEHFQAAAGDVRHAVETRQGLGACFFRKGLYPLAARQFEAALAEAGAPGSERWKELCYHLGLVAERLDDRPGALARYLSIYEVDIGYRDVARKIDELKT